MTIDLDALTPLDRMALAHIHKDGRVHTINDLQRLPMVALKAMGIVEEAFEDLWQLKRGPMTNRVGNGVIGGGRRLVS
jgi:hypothetical protein